MQPTNIILEVRQWNGFLLFSSTLMYGNIWPPAKEALDEWFISNTAGIWGGLYAREADICVCNAGVGITKAPFISFSFMTNLDLAKV